jgi:hypothetical protein
MNYPQPFRAWLLAALIIATLATIANSASAQSTEPASIDFGNIEVNPIVGHPTTTARTVTLTNTSATEILTIYGGWCYNGKETEINQCSELGLDEVYYLRPGEHRRYAVEFAANDTGEYHGIFRITTSFPSSKARDTIKIPVNAHAVHSGKAYLTHYDITEHKTCDCYLNRFGTQGPIYTLYPQIINGTADTLRLDSISRPAPGSAVVLSDSVYTWDTLTTTLGGNRSHQSRPPRDILPTMPLDFTIWFNALPIGERFYLLRAYLTNKRTGEHFTLQDTIRGGVQRYLERMIIYPSYGNHANVRFGDVDSTQLGFSMGMCSVPNDGPVVVDRISFRGRFQNNLTLLSSSPERYIASPPQTLQCGDGLFFRVRFAPETIGTSIDTAWISYSYTSTTGTTVHDSSYILLYLESIGPNAVTITPLDIDAPRLAAIPNPAHAPGDIELHLIDTDPRYITVQLYDAIGRATSVRALPLDATGYLRIQLGTLSPGEYTAVARDRRSGRTIATSSIIVLR